MTPLIVLPAESWKWFSHASFFYKGESRWNNSLQPEKMGVAHLLVLFVEVRGGCDRETKGFCNPMPQSKPCFFVSFCLNVTIFYTKKSTRHSIKHETSNWDQKPIRKVFTEVVGQAGDFNTISICNESPSTRHHEDFHFQLYFSDLKAASIFYMYLFYLYICVYI